ncbi:MAG: HEPN domain-containing protein [Spirochaetales bacterium]|nr:HEPN domain-containing protein [Spirochaetales bacterium]
MKEPKTEAKRWLSQAENDLEFAIVGLREKFYAQVCFQCQQVSEKALKSIRYASGERIVYGHALVDLASEMDLPAQLKDELAVLDQYYIPTRYPNGLPGGVPYAVYTKRQADDAVKSASTVVKLAHEQIE